MPELPRLKQFTDISVVPRPTPEGAIQGVVQRTIAQGASQMESILGQITAKDVAQGKAERDAAARLAAQNGVHDSYTNFRNEADKVRYGELGNGAFAEDPVMANKDPNAPVSTDDLPRVYQLIQKRNRQALVDVLGPHGPVAQYAGVNEFDTLTNSHLEKLYTDRDHRKIGDLQGGFRQATQNITDLVADGTLTVDEGIERYEAQSTNVASMIYTPEQRKAMHEEDILAIKTAPQMNRVANGQGDKVFEELQAGKILKDLTPKQKLDFEEIVLNHNWKQQARLDAKQTREKREFDEASGEMRKDRFKQLDAGKYTRPMLETDAPFLTKEDHSILRTALTFQEQQGGKGNGPAHARYKYDINLHPDKWNPDRIANVVEKDRLNPIEGVNLLDELAQARTRQRTAENDPNHFTKDPTFKRYEQGLEKLLGVINIALLKPQDQAIVEQAKLDFYHTFLKAYEHNSPMPNPQVEAQRILKLYKPLMQWQLDSVSPYKDLKEAARDYAAGKLTTERFIEIGEILRMRLENETQQLLEKSEPK